MMTPEKKRWGEKGLVVLRNEHVIKLNFNGFGGGVLVREYTGIYVSIKRGIGILKNVVNK